MSSAAARNHPTTRAGGQDDVSSLANSLKLCLLLEAYSVTSSDLFLSIYVDLRRIHIGLCQIYIDLCRIDVDLCRIYVDLCKSYVDLCRI